MPRERCRGISAWWCTSGREEKWIIPSLDTAASSSWPISKWETGGGLVNLTSHPTAHRLPRQPSRSTICDLWMGERLLAVCERVLAPGSSTLYTEFTPTISSSLPSTPGRGAHLCMRLGGGGGAGGSTAAAAAGAAFSWPSSLTGAVLLSSDAGIEAGSGEDAGDGMTDASAAGAEAESAADSAAGPASSATAGGGCCSSLDGVWAGAASGSAARFSASSRCGDLC